MDALQLTYTSCRSGQGNGQGFQIRAESVGLTREDRDDLVRAGGYEAPRVPGEPTPEEVAAFPVALRVLRTRSGRLGVVHAVYTGRDYSGRWGNYFVHGLLLPAAPADVWPVDLLSASWWERTLRPEDDVEGVRPPALPVLTVDPTVLMPVHGWESVAERLARPGAVDRLAAMIRALRSHASTSRPVVLGGRWDDAMVWLSAVQRAFPPSLAFTIQSSTYVTDLRDAFALSIVPTGAGARISDVQRNFQFFVFDAEVGDSQVPGQDSYADVLARWLRDDQAQVRRFHEFTDDFELTGFGTDLDDLLAVFRLPEAGEGAVGAEDVARAVRTLARAGRPGRTRPVDRVRRALVQHVPAMSVAALEQVLDALAEVTTKGMDGSLLQVTWDGAFARLCAAGEGPHATLSRLATAPGIAKDPAEAVARTREALRHRLAGPGAITVVLAVALRARDRGLLDEVIERVVEADPSVDAVAEAFELIMAADGDAAWRFVLCLADRVRLESLSGALARRHRGAPQKVDALIERLRIERRTDAWEASVVAVLAGLDDPLAAWARTRESVLGKASDPDALRDRVVSALLARTRGSAASTALACTWVTDGTLDGLRSADLRDRVVVLADAVVPLDRGAPDPYGVAAALLARSDGRPRRTSRGEPMVPDRTALRSLMDRPAEGDAWVHALRGFDGELSTHLVVLPTEERQRLVCAVLARLLGGRHDAARAAGLAGEALANVDPDAVARAIHALGTAADARLATKHLVFGWRTFLSAPLEDRRAGRVVDAFRDGLLAATESAPRSMWAVIAREVPKGLGGAAIVQWKIELTELEEARVGVMGRIGRGVRSVFGGLLGGRRRR